MPTPWPLSSVRRSLDYLKSRLDGIEFSAIASGIVVPDENARLGLTIEQALGNIVRQADTDQSYILITGGDPGNPGDWMSVGSGAVQISDVVGLEDILAGGFESGNLLLVDVTAEPETGERGNLAAPFDKIYDAVDAAEPGDFVLVRPGIHRMRNQIGSSLAKPGIHLHFMDGCRVYYGYTVFNSTSDEWVNAPDLTLPFKCTGRAEFINYADAVFRRLFNAGQTGGGSNPGVDWCIEFLSFTSADSSETSDTGPLDANGNPSPVFPAAPALFFQDVTGSHNVRIRCHGSMHSHNSFLNFESLNGGSLDIDCRGDITAVSGHVARVRNNGPLEFRARRITSNDSVATILTDGPSSAGQKNFHAHLISNDAGPVINIAHSGSFSFYAKFITSIGDRAAVLTGGSSVNISKAVVTTTSVLVAIQCDVSAGVLTLKDCFIVTSGPYSINGASPTAVRFLSSTYATAPVGPNITVDTDVLLTDSGAAGTAEWGGITGDIADQADLIALLDGKADLSNVVDLTSPQQIIGPKKFSEAVEITTLGQGVILPAPNGERWRVDITNSGNLITRDVGLTFVQNDDETGFNSIMGNIPPNWANAQPGAPGDPDNEKNILVIGESVSDIGDNAFDSWESYTGRLIIPASVVAIGDVAFSTWLSNNQPLVIPDSVSSLGVYAFTGWSSNNQPLVVGASVASIGDFAFSFWTAMTAPIYFACPFSALSGSNILHSNTTPRIYARASEGWPTGTTQTVSGSPNPIEIVEWTSYPYPMP